MSSEIYKFYEFKEIPLELKSIIDFTVKKEFGDSHFFNDYDASVPKKSLLVLKNSKLVAFSHLVVQMGKVNELSKDLGGIMNLVVLKEFRGQGLSKGMVKKQVQHLFNGCNVDLIIGFPFEDTLFQHYEKMGYKAGMFNYKALSKKGPREGLVKSIVIPNPKKPMKLNEIKCIDFDGRPW